MTACLLRQSLPDMTRGPMFSFTSLIALRDDTKIQQQQQQQQQQQHNVQTPTPTTATTTATTTTNNSLTSSSLPFPSATWVSRLRHLHLIAACDINPGQILWVNRSNQLTDPTNVTVKQREIATWSRQKQDLFLQFTWQIDHDLYRGPTHWHQVERDATHLLRHHCDPNAWFQGDDVITARRFIRKGERISIDYGTIHAHFSLIDCRCGSTLCRHSIGCNDWKSKELQVRYGSHFMVYILRKMDQLTNSDQSFSLTNGLLFDQQKNDVISGDHIPQKQQQQPQSQQQDLDPITSTSASISTISPRSNTSSSASSTTSSSIASIKQRESENNVAAVDNTSHNISSSSNSSNNNNGNDNNNNNNNSNSNSVDHGNDDDDNIDEIAPFVFPSTDNSDDDILIGQAVRQRLSSLVSSSAAALSSSSHVVVDKHSIIYSSTHNSDNNRAQFGIGRMYSLHKDVVIRDTKMKGKGLFAKSFIPQGTIVWDDHDHWPHEHCLTWSQVQEKMKDAHLRSLFSNYLYQVDDDSFLGPTNEQEVYRDAASLMNHSCEPSVWFTGDMTMSACRDIQAGEEITYDYATSESFFTRFPQCLCMASTCRQKVTPDDWQLLLIQEKYGQHFSSYLLNKIRLSCESASTTSASPSVSSSPLPSSFAQ